MRRKALTVTHQAAGYDVMLDRMVRLIDEAQHALARTLNAIVTGTYWLIGRHIIEFEQQGKTLAEYGGGLLKWLAADLTSQYGHGYSERILEQMRLFYQSSQFRRYRLRNC